MKTYLIGAIALAFAYPAAAQTAPTADTHSGHSQQGSPGMDHSQHKGMDHGKDGKPAHDCMACCAKAKESGAKMDCDMHSNNAPAPAGHEGHKG